MALGFAGGTSPSASSTSSTDPATPSSQNGTNVMTGYASQFNPNELASSIYNNPWEILGSGGLFNGINKTGAGYQNLRNIGADPLTLYNIMQGGQGTDLYNTNTAAGDYTNWLAGLFKSIGTAGSQGGGRDFSGKELLQSIFNPKAGSSLAGLETNGDSSTQMRTLFNLLQAASAVGMNPLAARGYQGALQNAGDTALGMQINDKSGMGAANMPMYKLLASIAPGLTGGQ